MRVEGKIWRLAQRLAAEQGAASVWAIYMVLITMVLGALTIDAANGWRVRNQLQITADAAALAAAAKLPDTAAARALALEVAQKNLGAGEAALSAEDVRFGTWVEGQGFAETEGEANAVRVTAARTTARGNALETVMMPLVGVDALEPGASAIAVSASTESAGGALGCEDAMILTSAYMDTGGGNTLKGNICLHGKTGLHTGGGDYYAGGVQLSAATKGQVTVNYTVPGSATADEVARGSDLAPVVLPKLKTMFEALWSDISKNLASPNGKDLIVDGYYTGKLLPDFLKDSNGKTAIVYVDNYGWWSAQPGQIKPYTIYLVNHGMQISGGVQVQNAAIIARGDIGVGGGTNLHYTNDYFFSTGTINTGGSIYWGDTGNYCATGRYSVYAFAYNTVSLGGWGGGSGAHGLFGAAATFSPGGAMQNSGGLYFESSNNAYLGGNLKFQGCGTRLEAFYDQALPQGAAKRTEAGRLKR